MCRSTKRTNLLARAESTVVEENFIFWYWLTLVYMFAWISISMIASSHAVMYKRDGRSLVGWFGVIWLAPIAGAAFYLMFGINRIHRRAHQRLKHGGPSIESDAKITASLELKCREKHLADPYVSHLGGLADLVTRVVGRPLLSGNQITALQNGEEAFPQMLEAIDAAQHSVNLCTYIFAGDHAGELFMESLKNAVTRGVEVRLLIDDVGAWYSWPSAFRKAKAAFIPAARFMPVSVPWLFYYSNLRNHRKILVVDGKLGFTGGMNIRQEHCLDRKTKHPIRDIHFQLTGPVVAQIQQTFARDWFWTTGERLESEIWFPEIYPTGSSLARGISDGPDEDHGKLRFVLLGAIANAKSSILIATPYLLPEAALIAALNVAVLRGVKVTIVIPEQTNLSLVQWASTAQLWQLLEHGCHVWLSDAPFDHSKLMIVDEQWSLLGSMNWDPRSLRLNFEFNVECYDPHLASTLTKIVETKIQSSRQCSLADVDNRPMIVRLRDGFARVLTPYL